MTVKEYLLKELDGLDEKQLHEIEEYIRFIKFRSRFIPSPAFDERQISRIYAESAEEDRQLAEEGMADYANSLAKEDKR
jgi:hypothetical protein